ncbi:M28 family peptidase [Nocardioides sp. Y6]|uniref:M28 family peptidase n=1 Tax=Nocardioides malaquae TaxID=2773426 RepID=A0ABR9RSD4_9ACTN|nr:M28 family peptidase [Nocardioides malaquae]
MFRAVVGGAAAALVITAAPVTSASGQAEQGPGHDRGAGQVTGKATYRHLEAFQQIADDNDGTRATGTPGYEASGRYVERQLRKAGYRTERQYFDVETFTVDEVAIEVPGVDLDPVPFSYSSSTDGTVEAELVAPSNPLGCTDAQWDGVEATGKIAVVSRGECPFADKTVAAAEAGAAAVIVYNNTTGALNGTLGNPIEGSAPGVGVTQAEGEALLGAMDAGPVTGSFLLQTSIETQETFNVLAETRGGDPDNVVMLGAHLDSAPEGPGISDNATGSAAVLETAIQLAKGNRGKGKGHSKHGRKHDRGPATINNKVRFAWWGAEELGLHGSNHYVADLQANAPEELDKLAVYLNFDMVGSPNYVIGVYDANESTYEAGVEVPQGSIEAEKVFTDHFDAIGQPWVDMEYSGRSDYAAFIDAGVASTGLFTGADGTKTEEEAALFGGTAGLTYDPNYHAAGDDINNVSKEALDINARAIGAVARQLAYSTEAINGVKPPKTHPGKGHGKKKDRKDKKEKRKGPRSKRR